MHVFNSRADFDAQMKSVKKWMRTGQALDGVSELQHDVAYSIGDSLVYWWVNAHEAATADLVGHRRYHAVLAPLDGDLTVEVAPREASPAPAPTAISMIASALRVRGRP